MELARTRGPQILHPVSSADQAAAYSARVGKLHVLSYGTYGAQTHQKVASKQGKAAWVSSPRLRTTESVDKQGKTQITAHTLLPLCHLPPFSVEVVHRA